jgi:hypothetical protein
MQLSRSLDPDFPSASIEIPTRLAISFIGVWAVADAANGMQTTTHNRLSSLCADRCIGLCMSPPKAIASAPNPDAAPDVGIRCESSISRIEAPLRFATPPCRMTLRRDSSVDRCHVLVRRFATDAPNEYHDYDDFSSTAVRQIVPMAEKGGGSRIDRCGNHGGVCVPGSLISARGALATP